MGVSSEDVQVILDVHNKFRNKIAAGDELEKYGFPPASNMMQFVWDKELEQVAQKHALQCVFEHDCNECRQVGKLVNCLNCLSSIICSPTANR